MARISPSEAPHSWRVRSIRDRGGLSFIDNLQLTSMARPLDDLDRAATFEGSAKGDLVGVLEVAADGEAARQT